MSTHFLRNLGLAFTAAVTAHAQNSGDKVPGRFIVELKPGESVPAVVAKHAVLPDVVFSDAFRGFAGDLPPGKEAALKQDPSVLSVVEDRVIAALKEALVTRLCGWENVTVPGPLIFRHATGSAPAEAPLTLALPERLAAAPSLPV